MFHKLLLVTVLVNLFFYSLGRQSQNPVQTNCPEAVGRFREALLRTTTKSLKVFSEFQNETGSISPFASFFLIASFACFAIDETREELFRELNLRSIEEVMCVFTQLNDEVQSIRGCAAFVAAPSIFGNICYPFTSAFKKKVDEIALNGLARNFDFSQSTGDAVNKLIAYRTNNKIRMAVNDYSIFNSSTELVAVSGVYWTLSWEIEFQKTDEVTQFRSSPSESAPQLFLYQDAVYNYAHSELLSAQVVQVNTCYESLEVWFFLPDCPFTENAMIDKMAENSDWCKEIKDAMEPTRLDLYIPFYNKSNTADSMNILQKTTEMKTIFDSQTIALRGAIEGDVKAAVTAGVQTTFVLSSFKGGPVPVLPKGPKTSFKADNPFAFMLFRFGNPILVGVFRQAM